MSDGATFVVFRTSLDGGAYYVDSYTVDSAAAAVKRAHEAKTGRPPATVEEIDIEGEYIVGRAEDMQTFSIEEGGGSE